MKVVVLSINYPLEDIVLGRSKHHESFNIDTKHYPDAGF
jgi:hypothetical protein